MRLLFWNTHRNLKINDYIRSMVIEHEINIVVLSEYSADIKKLIGRLREDGRYFSAANTKGADRITILYSDADLEPANQDECYSLQIIDKKIILCGTHLYSDLFGNNSQERYHLIRVLMEDIHSMEKEIGTEKVVIIGDMNEMPYGIGCLSADGFHGLPALTEENSKERTVRNRLYKKFYNPMWSFMGDNSYPPGTYYYSKAALYTPFWFMFDQVIISQELISLFNKDELRIITECKIGKLYTESRIPNEKISDHFPIMCEIREDDQV